MDNFSKENWTNFQKKSNEIGQFFEAKLDNFSEKMILWKKILTEFFRAYKFYEKSWAIWTNFLEKFGHILTISNNLDKLWKKWTIRSVGPLQKLTAYVKMTVNHIIFPKVEFMTLQVLAEKSVKPEKFFPYNDLTHTTIDIRNFGSKEIDKRHIFAAWGYFALI